MSTSPLTRYPGKDADVVWDERLCIHIGECGRAFGDLFVGGRKPWCQPDLATVAEVVDVVGRCPSGALVYEVRDGKTVERPAARNTIAVTYNGPLFVRGDLAIEGAPSDMPGVRFRAALCRLRAVEEQAVLRQQPRRRRLQGFRRGRGARGRPEEGRGRQARDQAAEERSAAG